MLESRAPMVGLGFIVRNLGGHGYGVRSVLFSPDGTSIVSGSYDGTLRIWGTHGPFPSPLANRDPFRGHTGAITSISYSPHGTIIASGSTDRTIRLWEPKNGQLMGRPLKGHTGYVNSVTFSPSGHYVVSGSADKTVRLWDIRNEEPESVLFEGHSNWVHAVASSPHGARIASGSHDKSIRVWDVESEAAISNSLEGHAQAVCSVAFSPDGSQVISGSEDKTLRLWDVRSGRATSKPYVGHTQGVYSVAISPDGRYAASGSWDKTVCVWDIRNGSLALPPFEGHSHWVHSVAFSPCGTRVVSGSEDCNVMIWNTREDEPDGDIESGSPDSEAAEYYMPPQDGFNVQTISTPPLSRFEPIWPSNNVTGNQPRFTVEVKAKQMSSLEMFQQVVAHGCTDLSSQIDPSAYTTMAIHGGAMGDIYKGKLRSGLDIAVKVWRVSSMPEDGSRHMKRAMREIYHWSKIKHENIQELMGVVLLHNRLGMVSLWMENGNLKDYIRANPSSNRYSLCHQVAAGVSHLHMNGMVHGDLKAVNILVSENGIAKISDFDHSILSDSTLVFSETTNRGGGTLRWMAPELLLEGETPADRSRECDVYALGMTMLVGSLQ
ncbi:tyrosine kinase catalytic domain protein [Rhizoctonia solani AG-3 Rhs1AP]|uniref:Tyrosine kinase catalytic domain protein n=1 Tax=Rhizoctonia solani AG-3 Rhs1AP TaxID=1086054 RepID=A0A0A1UK35_9AGAM|nr:tyrosine kinase catalytic domain protein [Rhizoctonia solani AG-3 Rhs1AP]